MHPKVPLLVGNVPIDYLSIGQGEEHLETAFANAVIREGFAIAPIEAVIYLKVKSNRPDDHRDVSQLVLAGIDVQRVREYFLRHASQKLIDCFEMLVSQAQTIWNFNINNVSLALWLSSRLLNSIQEDYTNGKSNSRNWSRSPNRMIK